MNAINNNANLEQFKEEVFKFKYKNVIFLYELSIRHIKRMDHLILDQIEENIGLVI